MERRISGHTGLLAVIGSPVGHSASPAMYNYSFERLGLDYAYVAFDIKTEEVKDAIKAYTENLIGYAEIEQLFKYCIRTQAARTSTEEMVSVSFAPAPCPVQTEEEFLSALFDKMDKLISAPQQECVDYMELVDDCVMYYGWKREQATVFVEKLLSASKNCFMNIT